MGAAAQLGRRTGLEHAHDLAVLLAEERDRADALGLGLRGLVVAHRRVGDHLLVGEALDLRELLGRDRVVMAEVEAQAIGRDHRTRLLHVRAEHLAQRPVQDVGGGVIAADAVAAHAVDRGLHLVAFVHRRRRARRTRARRREPAMPYRVSRTSSTARAAGAGR